MPRSLKLSMTHHQAFPSLAVSQGPQVSPSFLRAFFLQTKNHEEVRTTREQSHSTPRRTHARRYFREFHLASKTFPYQGKIRRNICPQAEYCQSSFWESLFC